MELFVVFGLVSALNMGATYGASELYANMAGVQEYTPVVEVLDVDADLAEAAGCKRRALFDSECKLD